jgi:hypothetical protein
VRLPDNRVEGMLGLGAVNVNRVFMDTAFGPSTVMRVSRPLVTYKHLAVAAGLYLSLFLSDRKVALSDVPQRK